jgi:cation diffusion facilitator family transporter
MKLLHGSETQYLEASIIVMIISVIMTGALVMFLNYVAKKTNSMVIKAYALHYKTDLYSNGAVILALVVIQFTNFHMIDAILGILIAIYIIYSAYELIQEGTLVLMDVAMEEELVNQVKEIIETNHDVVSYHQLHTRSAGQDLFVSVHLVFNISISLFDAHRICDKIEDDIADIDSKYQWHIIIHPDPYDDSEINEMED